MEIYIFAIALTQQVPMSSQSGWQYVYMFRSVTFVFSNQEKSGGKWQRLFNLSATSAYTVTFPFGPEWLANGEKSIWVSREVQYLFTREPFNYIKCKSLYFLASQSKKRWFLPASPSRYFSLQISVLQDSPEVVSIILQTRLVILWCYHIPFSVLAVFGFFWVFFLNFTQNPFWNCTQWILLYSHTAFLGVEAVAVSASAQKCHCFLEVVFSECCLPNPPTAGGSNLICSDQKLKLGRVWVFDGCL